MSGVTPLVDTLLPTTLAQRVDLIPLKPELTVAGPEPVPDSEKSANDTRLPSRAAVDRQLGTELVDEHAAQGAFRRLAGSGTLTLSATARAISTILGQAQGEAAPAVRGSAPLWRLPEAPAAHLLAPALARTVAGSGLFYESHLSRYVSGKLTLAQLAQEPQARLGPLAKSNPELIEGRAEAQHNLREALAFVALKPALPQEPGVQTQVQVPSQTTQAPGTAQLDTGQSVPNSVVPDQVSAGQLNVDLLNPEQLAVSPAGVSHATPEQAGMDSSPGNPFVEDQSTTTLFTGAGARPSPASVAAAYHTTSLPMSFSVRGESGAATANAALPSPETAHSTSHAPAAVVHPDAMSLVRQQLDLLAVPVFRWSGEAWPGAKMDWEIEEERDKQHEAPEGAPRVWNTRLNVSLPTLGVIEMRLSLADNTLQARLAATQDNSMALLRGDGETLRDRLEVAGLQLTSLQVVPLTAQTETQKNAAIREPATDNQSLDTASEQPEY